MNTEIESLFHEVADLAFDARRRYYDEHRVAEDIRCQVEALVAFDSGGSGALMRDIEAVAGRALAEFEPQPCAAPGGLDPWVGPGSTGQSVELELEASTGGLFAGQVVGAYRLRSPIGEGGMGSVWLAERVDGRFERHVAIKFLKIALGRQGQDRFLREGNLLGRLGHPSVAQLLDAGVTAWGPYLVLEHIDGEPIDRYCDTRLLNIEGRIRLFLQVLEAVSHAHANLIVHRDIKPANVVVSAKGLVKLLDFGIAKLVEHAEQPETATALTREGAMMTLLYAAPEQVTEGPITTATDVYALGVLLFGLFTGEHPAGPGPNSPAVVIKSIVEIDAPHLTELALTGEAARQRSSSTDKLRRQLRGDLETIVGKALKKNPPERYQEVATLAADLRRYLNHQPIEARPDAISYRARKFVRRNRTAVVLTTIAVTALLGGAVGTWVQARVANRERAIAQRRFNDVRELANRLFLIDRQVLAFPGNTRVRQLIVNTALEYLNRLLEDARLDPNLALDIATAYMRVGRVQGVPIATNLGQPEEAEKNLRIAEQLIASVLRAQPGNHMAYLRAAQIAHDRMVLAEDRRPDTEALPLARQSEAWLEKYLATGKIDEIEKQQVVIAGMNVAYWYGRQDLMDDSLRLIRRTIEIARAINLPAQAAAAQINLARALRGLGDFEGALSAATEAVRGLDESNAAMLITFELALETKGDILGSDSGISMGRTEEALPYFERAYGIARKLAGSDTADTDARRRVATSGLRLAASIRKTEPLRALEIYEEILARMAEVRNNSLARRNEVRALAESTIPLRQLGRYPEARRRIGAAFSKLSDMKLYPADIIEPGSPASDALCAQAELEAATGKIWRGIEIYQELFAKVTPTMKPESRLEDAAELSALYHALVRLHQRAGQPAAASAAQARRVDLWHPWQQKLPGNPFVQRQMSLE